MAADALRALAPFLTPLVGVVPCCAELGLRWVARNRTRGLARRNRARGRQKFKRGLRSPARRRFAPCDDLLSWDVPFLGWPALNPTPNRKNPVVFHGGGPGVVARFVPLCGGQRPGVGTMAALRVGVDLHGRRRWEGTAPLTPQSLEYKFTLGAWAHEALTPKAKNAPTQT